MEEALFYIKTCTIPLQNSIIGNTKSILIQGPNGVGKSIFIDNIQCNLKWPVFEFDLATACLYPSLESIQLKLYQVIDAARQSAPSLICLYNLDILSKEFDFYNLNGAEISCMILKGLKRIPYQSCVCVIASTRNTLELHSNLVPKKSNSMDMGFDTILTMELPNKKQRKSFLNQFSIDYNVENTSLDEWSCVSAGLTRREIQNCFIRDCIHNSLDTSSSSNFILDALTENRLKSVLFDSMKPRMDWKNVKGYPIIKKKCQDLVNAHVQQENNVYTRLGITCPKGILLSGPSGVGKTWIAKALCSHPYLNFISCKGHQLYGKYFGESEQTIRLLFKTARELSPCILFLDELDTIGMRRGELESSTRVDERILSTLLNEMDGIESHGKVLIVACTNRIHELDEALIRPGRLDYHIQIELPNELDRLDFLRDFCTLESELNQLVEETQGMTMAEMNLMIRNRILSTLDGSI